jgi:hypothetical protein
MTNRTDFSQDPIICKWQNKALQLDPDGNIKRCFSKHYSSFELIHLAGAQPKRFLPVIIGDADECSECNKEFNWEDPATRGYLSEFKGYGGEPMPEDEKDLFLLDIDALIEMVVCEGCMRKMLRRYQALMCCSRAARRREKIEEEESTLIEFFEKDA